MDVDIEVVVGAAEVEVPEGEADRLDLEMLRRMAGVSRDSRALGSWSFICRPMEGRCITCPTASATLGA